MASLTSGGLVKRTVSFHADTLDRLRERGRRLDRSVDWQIREILRAVLDAEEAPQANGSEAAA